MGRFDLTDFEWSVIEPLLPNKPRGVPRVDDRRVLNGIFWRLRTGAPWADIPARYGPYTTCVNRFNRWRKAGAPPMIGSPVFRPGISCLPTGPMIPTDCEIGSNSGAPGPMSAPCQTARKRPLSAGFFIDTAIWLSVSSILEVDQQSIR